MQFRNTLQAWRALVLSPAAEQLGTLLSDVGIREIGGSADPQSFQQRLVGESSLETWAGILDQAVQDGQSSELAMDVAVLELLANGAGSLCGARSLQLDDFYKVWDATHVIFIICLGGQRLNAHCDGGIWFLLSSVSVPVYSTGNLALLRLHEAFGGC